MQNMNTTVGKKLVISVLMVAIMLVSASTGKYILKDTMRLFL